MDGNEPAGMKPDVILKSLKRPSLERKSVRSPLEALRQNALIQMLRPQNAKSAASAAANASACTAAAAAAAEAAAAA